MEEDSVSSLHLQVQSWHRWVIVLNAMVHLVDAALRECYTYHYPTRYNSLVTQGSWLST